VSVSISGFGCITSKAIVCDNGTTCPEGTVCDLLGERCVTESQLDACQGFDQGADCMFPGGSGLCDNGACVSSVCGNGYIEPDELCDDENRDDLDGCRNDCKSDETCGNGVLDLLLFEQCDDGNYLNHDRCTQDCRAETAVWSQVARPAPRSDHAMAYDPEHRRIILFGGQSADANIRLNDTWFYADGNWIPGPEAPYALTPRSGARMVYDSDRKRIVLFGGFIEDGLFGSGIVVQNDTWFLDGNTWVPGPVAPPGLHDRWRHALAYDDKHDRVVLFGGEDDDEDDLGDTWFLEDDVWVAGPSGPSARMNHAMAYSPTLEKVVLYGGNSGSNETWLLDDMTWSLVPLQAEPPSGRSGHSLVFDPTSATVIACGGISAGTRLDETWAFDGVSWTEIFAAPAPVSGHAMAYDAGAGRMVLFGGHDGAGPSQNLWFLDSESFSASPLEPPPTYRPAAVYDRLRGNLIVGGQEVWLLRGTTWRQLVDAPGDVSRIAHAMAFHEGIGQTVLFGGQSDPNNTWLFDGETWTEIPAGPGAPPARYGHAMTYDADRHLVIMVGGTTQDDVWFFNGATWAQGPSFPQNLPAVFSLAYDRKNARTVLFGGGPTQDETWILDGEGWRKLDVGDTRPPPRIGHGTVYDENLGAIVIYGGRSNSQIVKDTWILDGETWTRGPDAPAGLGNRYAPVMTYDTKENRNLVYGGLIGIIPITTKSDTWAFRYELNRFENEICASSLDVDGDNLSGCEDPDCWGSCSACGNGVCNSYLETDRNCPSDCPPISP
jgi:cysteine-rich repeat protein